MARYLAIVTLLLAVAAAGARELTIEQLIAEAGLEEGATPVRELEGWRPPRVVLAPASLVSILAPEFPDLEFISASRSEAAGLASAADVILSWCSPEIVDAANRARWVQIFSAGAERCLSTRRILDGEVILTNAQKMTSPAIGEHAVTMALSLSRGIIGYAKAMSAGQWDNDRPMDSVTGKTMLVAGLGGIGRATAERANALGMRVVGTRNSSREGPDYVDYVGLSDELLELAAGADIVVNALPLTDKTRGLFDKDFFDAVKPGAIFINVARGASVVTDDLVVALKDGRLSAAGLDVTDPEPLPPDHALWQMENVIITPHVAWAGADRNRTRLLAVENLRRYIAGDALLNVVDPRAGY